MPTITDNAICIRRWDFSESSQTISLFTREHGVIRGLAKGAKRSKGAFSGGIDVLTRGQVLAIVKPHVELATITAWHLEQVYRGPRDSLPANRAGLYLADLVHHMVRDHDPHPRLFDALAQALDKLGDAGAVPMTLLQFQWAVLVESGFQPQLDRDCRTGAALPDSPTFSFDPVHGGISGGAGTLPVRNSWAVRRDTIELLRALEGDRIGSHVDPTTIRRGNRLLATYLAHLIGQEPSTLRWAFPDLKPRARESR